MVDFLDVTFNLKDGTYRPYRKPGDIPLYVHASSNHPKTIISNIPISINRRLSEISSDREVFDSSKVMYQDALIKSGYSSTLDYSPPTPDSAKKNSRKRKCLWWNPPWNMEVKTNLGAKFLKMIDSFFPKNHPLHSVFNRKNVKISYRTTQNLAEIISSHNIKIYSKTKMEDKSKSCNCRNECPLDGNCLEKNIIYQATVREAITKKEETYIGRTATSFKERYNNHKSSFKNRHLINGCELGKHIWKLKDQNIEVESIKWKILGHSKPFSPVSNVCNLCVKEKYFILYKPELGSLNKRTELTAGCRHKTKQLLVKN